MNALDGHADRAPDGVVSAAPSIAAEGADKPEVAGRSRREWMYLAERVFSHPRYALIILAALLLCAFENYWFVIAPLTLFFSMELGLRIWLQHEKQWRDRNEILFLLLDALATVGLLLILFMPTGTIVQSSIYLRLVRLLRGMYMLRMLRVFRFLTYETFVYSLPLAFLTLGLGALALGLHETALFIAAALLVELATRVVSLFKVLPKGRRRSAELCFAALDGVFTIALFGLVSWLPEQLVLLRGIRILVMLDPLSSLLLAFRHVASMHEVRKESGMLVSVMLLLLLFAGSLIWFVYPHMDLTADGVTDAGDYTVIQVIQFSFKWLIDPGTTPAEAFTPGLMLLTMFVAMTGVFFFALLVGLGTNVMAALLRELSNSPLSARVQLLLSGDNEKAQPILKVFGEMCARMRRSYFTVWIFFDQQDRLVSGFGNWLNVRQTIEGSRDVLRHFKLSGVHEMIFFHRCYTEVESMVDHHALVQEARLQAMDVGISLFTQSGMNAQLEAIYRDTLGAENFNSSAVTARMLYQMHHCSYMPELGIEMLDAIAGETGLFTVGWPAEVVPGENGASVRREGYTRLIESWASDLFEQGVNIVALRSLDGEFRLLSDLVRAKRPFEVSDVVALGREPSLWPSTMEQQLKGEPGMVRDGVLKTFHWPESWDLNLLFIGWHEGLPAMIGEMAEKHHKLVVNILNPGRKDDFPHHQKRLNRACEQIETETDCELKVTMHEWDGLDMSLVTPLLRGCKVAMLYPPETPDGTEDSLLEMWYHAFAGLLTRRKEEVKWWTPPKVMILPRERTNADALIRASERYPLLKIDIGSPDAFHDVYMARKMLSFAQRQADPLGYEQECKTFAFVDMLLGDVVLVEDEQTLRLLEHQDATWKDLYRESLRRGWVPLAYGLQPASQHRRDLYRLLDRAFPIGRKSAGAQLHLLAGTLIDEFEMPASSAITLFCRRGVLLQDDQVEDDLLAAADRCAEDQQKRPAAAAVEETVAEVAVEEEVVEEVEEAVAEEEVAAVEPPQPVAAVCAEDAQPEQAIAAVDQSEDVADEAVAPAQDNEQQERALAEVALEGEVMQEIWPKEADPRLLRVLTRQIEGALTLLNDSTESGLMKIAGVLEKEAGSDVEGDIMEALTDLQNIDRVMQRLHNVRSCLDEWSAAVKDQGSDEAAWKDEVAGRYVMEEERLVLRDEL